MQLELILPDIGYLESWRLELGKDHRDPGKKVGEVDEEFGERFPAHIHHMTVALFRDLGDPVNAEVLENRLGRSFEDLGCRPHQVVSDLILVGFIADEDVDVDLRLALISSQTLST